LWKEDKCAWDKEKREKRSTGAAEKSNFEIFQRSLNIALYFFPS